MTVLLWCRPCGSGRHGDCRPVLDGPCQCCDVSHAGRAAEVEAWFAEARVRYADDLRRVEESEAR